jgi:hypothetical protein
MNKDIKNFIGTLLKFFPVAAIIYLVLLVVWGDFMPEMFKKNLNYRIAGPGHTLTRFKEAHTVKDLDLLIIGSSHAYRGFDTRIFRQAGYNKVFNLGTSAQTPLQTKALLKRYIDVMKPKQVIYEVYPITFSLDGVEAGVDLISNDANDVYSWQMALDMESIKVLNTMFYSCYRQALGHNTDESLRKRSDTYIPGGYVEKDMAHYKPKKHDPKILELRDSQEKAFGDIMQMFKDRKINYVLVNAPVAKSLYNSYQNNAKFDSIMKTYGPYYNFNQIMQLNDSEHFYDADHLNQAGVKLFNEKLLSMGILKK